jgi:cytochrome oxidase Cu insertion factor (SCO1/SenC/PrrC family)
MSDSKRNSKKYVLLVGVLFLLPFSFIWFFGKMGTHHFNTLPFYGPDGVHVVVRDSSDDLSGIDDPVYDLIVSPEGVTADMEFFKVPPYSLTNHLGQRYGSEQLKGKVYLAMFISSESEFINLAVKACAPVHFKYRGEEDIELVFITNSPSTDTPEKLKKFIDKVDKSDDYDYVSNKWQYLTGDSLQIAQLRSDGFFIPSVEESAILWLVDTEGHLRGKYRPSWDFQVQGSDQLKKAREDIALLKKELDLLKYEAEHEE